MSKPLLETKSVSTLDTIRSNFFSRPKLIASAAALTLFASGCGETVVDAPIKIPSNAQELGGDDGDVASNNGVRENMTLNFVVNAADAPFVECGSFHKDSLEGAFTVNLNTQVLANNMVQITCTGPDLHTFPIERFETHVAPEPTAGY